MVSLKSSVDRIHFLLEASHVRRCLTGNTLMVVVTLKTFCNLRSLQGFCCLVSELYWDWSVYASPELPILCEKRQASITILNTNMTGVFFTGNITSSVNAADSFGYQWRLLCVKVRCWYFIIPATLNFRRVHQNFFFRHSTSINPYHSRIRCDWINFTEHINTVFLLKVGRSTETSTTQVLPEVIMRIRFPQNLEFPKSKNRVKEHDPRLSSEDKLIPSTRTILQFQLYQWAYKVISKRVYYQNFLCSL